VTAPDSDTSSDGEASESSARERDLLFQPVSRRSAATWNMVFFYTGQLLSITRNLLLVPLFLRYIGKDEYNAWLVSGFVLAQLTNIDFGLMGPLTQQVAVAFGNRERAKLERLIGGGLVTLLVLSVAVGSVTALLSPFLPRFIDVAPDVAHRLTLCVLIVAVANSVQLFAFASGGLLKAFQRTFPAGLLAAIAEACALASTAILVVRGWGLYSIALGIAVRSVFEATGTGIMFAWLSRRVFRLHLRWDRGEALRLWRLSSYQFLTQIAGRLKSSLDSFVIGVMLGTDLGGGYALTIRAHETVRVFSSGVAGSLSPVLAHLHGQREIARFREIALTLFKVQAWIAAIGYGGVIAFNYSFMQLWVGPGIYAGAGVSVVTALAGIAYLFSAAPYEVTYARGGFKAIMTIVWSELVFRYLVMIALLGTIGILGTPMASLAGQVLGFFLPLAWLSTRALQISRKELLATLSSSVALIAVPLALAGFVAIAVPPPSTWPAFVVEAGLFVVACAVATGWMNRDLVRFVLRRGRA
jgi:O-antigen/teichoic acid export membrane protein